MSDAGERPRRSCDQCERFSKIRPDARFGRCQQRNRAYRLSFRKWVDPEVERPCKAFIRRNDA